MSLNGWIRLPRSILSEPWYREATPLARALHEYLVLSANFAPTVTRTGLALQPGQLVTSWAALSEALACRERGRIVKPHPSEVRRTADLLRKAGIATWCPTGRPTYTGIVVTLERWALYAGEAGDATDHATEDATEGLSEVRQHRKNTTGLSADEKLRQEMDAFAERCRRDAQELAEIRAREAGRGVH